MKRHLITLGVTLAAAAGLAGQEPAQIHTRPAVPPRDALERLNLKLGWRVYLPSVGLRDGVHSVYLIDNQVFVLTKFGTAVALDLATGATQWRVTVGEPVDITQPVTADDQFVYVIKRAMRYALVRRTGEQAGPPTPIVLAGIVGFGEEHVAWYGDMFYTVREDFSLTAQVGEGAFLLWRFALGGRVQRLPSVTNDDVFIAVEGTGLHRIDRLTGELRWANREATRFVAMNPKFVYAMDRTGRLLVLDYARGTRLSVFDTGCFVFPISNELTDRIFLAAHNGLLVCLHDRDFPTPLRVKTPEAPRPADKGQPTPETPAEAPKGDEKTPDK